MCRTRNLALARLRLRMYSAASRAECNSREDIVEESKVGWAFWVGGWSRADAESADEGVEVDLIVVSEFKKKRSKPRFHGY